MTISGLMKTRSFCLVAALAACAHWSDPAGVQGGVIRGAVYQDDAYVSTEIKVGTDTYLCLRYARLPDGEPRNTVHFTHSRDKPKRWRLQEEKLWIITRTWTPLFTDHILRFDLPELQKGKVMSGPVSEGPGAYSFVNGWGPVPTQGVFKQAYVEFPMVVHYDYLPINNDSIRLFLLSAVCTRELSRS
jgi:hypothetical protein